MYYDVLLYPHCASPSTYIHHTRVPLILAKQARKVCVQEGVVEFKYAGGGVRVLLSHHIMKSLPVT